MAKKQPQMGKCCLCSGEFDRAQMHKHLISCIENKTPTKASGKGTKTFHILVQGYGFADYWLIVEAKASAKLDNLDGFLRDIWLECCGHLSSFKIDGMDYDVHPDESIESESMDFRLDDVLEVGTKFSHIYDFGTSTELSLKVLSEQQRKDVKKPLTLLARNNPPEAPCQKCGQPAIEVCTDCLWSGRMPFLCKKCAKSHDCPDEMFLPVVNSPRMGVCGYEG